MEVGGHDAVLILDGHAPPGKGDHLAPMGHVKVIQSCLLYLDAVVGKQCSVSYKNENIPFINTELSSMSYEP